MKAQNLWFKCQTANVSLDNVSLSSTCRGMQRSGDAGGNCL